MQTGTKQAEKLPIPFVGLQSFLLPDLFLQEHAGLIVSLSGHFLPPKMEGTSFKTGSIGICAERNGENIYEIGPAKVFPKQIWKQSISRPTSNLQTKDDMATRFKGCHSLPSETKKDVTNKKMRQFCHIIPNKCCGQFLRHDVTENFFENNSRCRMTKKTKNNHLAHTRNAKAAQAEARNSHSPSA